MPAPDLAQEVYDAWEDQSVTSYTMPAGSFTIWKQLRRRHPNFQVDGSACSLEAEPTLAEWPGNEFYPISIATSATSPIFDESPGGTDRTVSGLSGTVTPGVTTLTMIPGEILLDLGVGEEVMLLLGVDADDPVEPYAYRYATIQSVDTGTGVITFTGPVGATASSPTGMTVPDYVNTAGLQAETDPSLWWKIGAWGDWPSDANFSKGFGTHHGMQRFAIGELVHNIELNDFTINLVSNTTIATIPNGIWPISAVAVRDLRINNLTLNNPIGNMVHQWKCFDTVIDGVTVTGQGISKPNSIHLAEAYAFTAWGGSNLTFRNVNISANDTAVFNVEVNAGEMTIENLTFAGTFTSTRTYPSSPVILGWFSVIDLPTVDTASISATTSGGSSHAYDSFTSITYTGHIQYIGTSLTATLDFGYLKSPVYSSCEVTINNVKYGPEETEETTNTILHGAGFRDINIQGLILADSWFRIDSLGDIRSITDNFGNNYTLTTGVQKSFTASHWHQINSGTTALNNYTGKYLRFWQHNSGSTADGSITLHLVHLPRKKSGRFNMQVSMAASASFEPSNQKYGDLDIQVSLAGSLNYVQPTFGAYDIQVSLAGSLQMAGAKNGAMNMRVSMAGTLTNIVPTIRVHGGRGHEPRRATEENRPSPRKKDEVTF